MCHTNIAGFSVLTYGCHNSSKTENSVCPGSIHIKLLPDMRQSIISFRGNQIYTQTEKSPAPHCLTMRCLCSCSFVWYRLCPTHLSKLTRFYGGSIITELPNWSSACKLMLLIKPSAAADSSIFCFTDRQLLKITSVILQYLH